MLEAFIPYITAPEYMLKEDVPLIGDLKLQVFGPLVAVGVIMGWYRCLRYAKLKNLDEYLFRDYLFWLLVAAFTISHWVSVIFYFPHQIEKDPLVLLQIWNGLSSVGGFFGAFVGMTLYLRWYCARLPHVGRQPIMVYADATIFGLLIGWCFGRLGCSLVHDHPGKVVPEGTFLAVGPWPDGTWRYDLGLVEFMFAVSLCAFVYLVTNWKAWPPGRLTGLVATAYAPFRFFLDSLRADEKSRVIEIPDARYAGLTPAQWFTIAFFLVGIWLLFFRKPKDSDFAYAKDSDRVEREQAEAAKAKAAATAAAADDEEDDEDDEDESSPGPNGKANDGADEADESEDDEPARKKPDEDDEK